MTTTRRNAVLPVLSVATAVGSSLAFPDSSPRAVRSVCIAMLAIAWLLRRWGYNDEAFGCVLVVLFVAIMEVTE